MEEFLAKIESTKRLFHHCFRLYSPLLFDISHFGTSTHLENLETMFSNDFQIHSALLHSTTKSSSQKDDPFDLEHLIKFE